jgi:hypothetical protein
LRIVLLVLAAVCAPGLSAADQRSDFESAFTKWRSANIRNYTFVYVAGGAVLVAPKCGDAQIRVRVRNGISAPPVVVKGARHCPAGTRGRSIDFDVPATIEDAFGEIRRYLYDPPTPVRITVSYDPTYGVPLNYYAEKLKFQDNDEGFKIVKFGVD